METTIACEDNKNQSIPILRRRQDIDEIDAAISKLSLGINSANYDLMVLIREFDERAGWLKWSFTDCVSWLKWRCDLSHNAARDKLRIAHALKNLAQMSDEFSRGILSYSKVRALTRVATPETEAELITMAHKMSAAHVEQYCRRHRNASPGSSKRANSAYAARSLRSWRNEERGVMTITLEVPIEDGDLFEKAVDKAAASLSGDGYACHAVDGNKTSWCAVQADAAIVLAKTYLSGTANIGVKASAGAGASIETDTGAAGQSSSTADHYQVMVHVDEEALVGRMVETDWMNGTSSTNGASQMNEAGRMDGTEQTDGTERTDKTVRTDNPQRANKPGGTTGQSDLPIETVRRLCCDGSIVPVVENAKGEPLNVGRKVRTVTTAVRRALWARDRGCAFPGCSHTRYVDAHHIRHWADGGETSVENMLLLCSQHHRMVHEGGYSILNDHAGNHYFRRPDGKAVPECGYHENDWLDECVDAVADYEFSSDEVSSDYEPVSHSSAEYNSWDSVNSPIHNPVCNPIHDPVHSPVHSPVHNPVHNPVLKAVLKAVPNSTENSAEVLAVNEPQATYSAAALFKAA